MTASLAELHRRASEGFGGYVAAVREDQWHLPTPCTEWDVRQLVNHIVYENRWTPPLFAGATLAEVGDRYEGDLLDGDPAGAWDEASQGALAAVSQPDAMERTVHLSFGDVPGAVYTWQLFADHLIHGWDLAKGIGADDRIDPELVDACAEWFATNEEGYRSSGIIGPRIDVGDTADPQRRLLAAFGRSQDWPR